MLDDDARRSMFGRMSEVESEAAALGRWRFDEALPLWWKDGADRIRGASTRPSISMGRRWYGRTGRVSSPVKHSPIARLGGFGWDGPWRDAMRHALDYFRKYFVNVDATVVSVVDVDGKVSDPRFDLYDQAFALLAYASGHSGFGEAADWRRRAVTSEWKGYRVWAYTGRTQQHTIHCNGTFNRKATRLDGTATVTEAVSEYPRRIPAPGASNLAPVAVKAVAAAAFEPTIDPAVAIAVVGCVSSASRNTEARRALCTQVYPCAKSRCREEKCLCR
jgi:hypothetical protein